MMKPSTPSTAGAAQIEAFQSPRYCRPHLEHSTLHPDQAAASPGQFRGPLRSCCAHALQMLATLTHSSRALALTSRQPGSVGAPSPRAPLRVLAFATPAAAVAVEGPGTGNRSVLRRWEVSRLPCGSLPDTAEQCQPSDGTRAGRWWFGPLVRATQSGLAAQPVAARAWASGVFYALQINLGHCRGLSSAGFLPALCCRQPADVNRPLPAPAAGTTPRSCARVWMSAGVRLGSSTT
jgi:hypothetical protein